MGLAEWSLVFLVGSLITFVAFVVAGAVNAVIMDATGVAPCAPSRRAAITASVLQEQRRVIYARTLGPPAGWHEPQHVAIVPAPARYDDDDELDDIEDWDDDELEPEPAPAVTVPMTAPVVAPVAVPDWPTRQTVEQPEVVTVNRMAARFGALEIGGK